MAMADTETERKIAGLNIGSPHFSFYFLKNLHVNLTLPLAISS